MMRIATLKPSLAPSTKHSYTLTFLIKPAIGMRNRSAGIAQSEMNCTVCRNASPMPRLRSGWSRSILCRHQDVGIVLAINRQPAQQLGRDDGYRRRRAAGNDRRADD